MDFMAEIGCTSVHRTERWQSRLTHDSTTVKRKTFRRYTRDGELGNVFKLNDVL